MKEKKMLNFWSNISKTYGKAQDLEEKQRFLLSNFLKDKKGEVLELGCGNGKVLGKISKINKKIKLYGLDYSGDMIKEAKNSFKGINFINGDILNIEKYIGDKKCDTTFSLNTLHNLPNKKLIFSTFEKMKKLTKKGGYIIFDIRNGFNPFINYGYFKNRKKGLSFWTLNYFKVLSFFEKDEFEIFYKKGVYYKNVDESLFKNDNKLLRILYSIYLKITSFTIFSPYIFIIIRKK